MNEKRKKKLIGILESYGYESYEELVNGASAEGLMIGDFGIELETFEDVIKEINEEFYTDLDFDDYDENTFILDLMDDIDNDLTPY